MPNVGRRVSPVKKNLRCTRALEDFPIEVYEPGVASANAKALYIGLCHHRDRLNRVETTLEHMADRFEFSVSTIQRTLRELVEIGWIERPAPHLYVLRKGF